MKKHFFDNRKRTCGGGNTAGSALITVFGVSLIMMLAGATLLVMSRQSVHRIKLTVQKAQAQAVAEAGIADMVAKLGSNYVYWQNNTHTETFISNTFYHVTTQTQLNGNVLITSDGIFMDSSNRTIMELLGTLQTHYNDLYDLNSAIMSGDDVRFSTAAFTMNGNIHANQNALGSSGAWNGTINGNISASGSVSNLNPTGTTSNGAQPETIPPEGPFNFDSFRTLALDGGTYLEGNQSLSGTPIASPANGILYVNGNLTIQNHSSFSGTIVANGDITIVNHFTHTSISSNMPSLLSTGSIYLNNNITLNGVVYAEVNVIIRNHITVNGGVISGGYTEIQNCSTITSGTCYPAWDPLNPEVPPEVIVGGWLK